MWKNYWGQELWEDSFLKTFSPPPSSIPLPFPREGYLRRGGLGSSQKKDYAKVRSGGLACIDICISKYIYIYIFHSDFFTFLSIYIYIFNLHIYTYINIYIYWNAHSVLQAHTYIHVFIQIYFFFTHVYFLYKFTDSRNIYIYICIYILFICVKKGKTNIYIYINVCLYFLHVYTYMYIYIYV